MSTSHEAPNYVMFLCFVLLSLSYIYIFSFASHSQAKSVLYLINTFIYMYTANTVLLKTYNSKMVVTMKSRNLAPILVTPNDGGTKFL